MGTALITQAYRLELESLAARHVLVRMAHMALDRDMPPRYWGGWAPLAEALNRRPDLGETWSPAAEKAARKAVDRAIATLVESGYVVRTGRPRLGRQAEYTLHLDPLTEAIGGQDA